MKQFQSTRDLPVTGRADEETMAALDDGLPILREHTLTAADVSGQFGRDPRYHNAIEKLGEIFQSSPRLLRRLNPGASFSEGETITVPAVGGPLAAGSIHRIVVDTRAKTIKTYGADGGLLAYYPTTVGDDDTIPYGQWHIKSVTRNPYYRRVLRPSGKIRAMAPGPNNYVGNVWMALSAKHYGLHGSPEPDKISRQQSAGCIRMTNWDANEVASAIVKKATIVVR